MDVHLRAWLWDTVAAPVLQSLGYLETLEDEWPRIWWIPAGHLARFPLRAAGYHGHNSNRTVLDRVISSYSPSSRALIQSRSQRPPEGRTTVDRINTKAVLVGMPELTFAKRGILDVARIGQETPDVYNLSQSFPC